MLPYPPRGAESSHLTSDKCRFFTFIAPSGFDTLRLARTLDSLVRVSRRVNRDRLWSGSLDPRSASRAIRTAGNRGSRAEARSTSTAQTRNDIAQREPILTHQLAPHTSNHHVRRTRGPETGRNPKRPPARRLPLQDERCDDPIQRALSLTS